MPELPEVESIVRSLRSAPLEGKILSSVTRFCPKISSELEILISRSILGIERRGKHILFKFSGKMHLIVHLRMTGRFLLKKAGEKPIKHERVIFRFKDGTRLAFHDTRRFGTMTVTSQPAVIFQKLGVEPLDPAFSADHLFQLLSRRNKTLKAALLDQTLIAGIGNIYADEALWEAKLHPQQLCQNLTLEHTRRLHAALQMVLRKGIANGGTSLGEGTSNFHHLNGQSGKNQMTLNVYGRKGKPCRRCEKSLQRIIIAQRSTCFCPSCQKISILARSF